MMNTEWNWESFHQPHRVENQLPYGKNLIGLEVKDYAHFNFLNSGYQLCLYLKALELLYDVVSHKSMDSDGDI